MKGFYRILQSSWLALYGALVIGLVSCTAEVESGGSLPTGDTEEYSPFMMPDGTPGNVGFPTGTGDGKTPSQDTRGAYGGDGSSGTDGSDGEHPDGGWGDMDILSPRTDIQAESGSDGELNEDGGELDSTLASGDDVEDVQEPEDTLNEDVGLPDTGAEPDRDTVPEEDSNAADSDSAEGDSGGTDAGNLNGDEVPWEGGNGKSFVNLSKSESAHVQSLIEEAVEGMGFPFGDPRGPRNDDRFVVTRYFIVWLDQTGFVGKMNGLWRLNGAEGNNLNFSVRENGRPVNFLTVGERGIADFPTSYPGGEHAEFPNTTPEPNDNPDCANGDWCNQYGHEEASDIQNPKIPWWEACNGGGTVDWDTVFEPILVTYSGEELEMLWEAPLVKVADGDGNFDGDACHENWLFPDGIRRPVLLQAGYTFTADTPHIDRLFRFRNPEGNPSFTGPMSLIGGFVVTTWPNPHPMKELHHWMNPLQSALYEPVAGINLLAGLWNKYTVPPGDGDIVLGWIGQPFGLSEFPKDIPGRTAVLSHVGPSDNDDVGICLCGVHGGLEMGGGVLHGGISLPVEAGATSILSRRRWSLPGTDVYPQSFVYDVKSDFNHGTGDPEDDGWAAATGFHDAGHMLFGPYTTKWCGFKAKAEFLLLVDNNTADDLVVASIDIYDSTTDTVLGERAITRKEFSAPFVYQNFSVDFDTTGFAGHTLEARLYWTDVSYVKVNAVTVTLATD